VGGHAEANAPVSVWKPARHRAAASVFAPLLLAAVSWPAVSDEPGRLNAILLVARGGLADPNFTDSVVLVMNHLAEGPVGVMVNRPTDVTVAELFPDIKRLA
jgi:hypothetical protein